MKYLRKLHRNPVVRVVMGWPNSTLHKNIQDGLFIEAVKIGERSSAWPSDEVDALQDAYIAGNSKEEIRALVLKLKAARKAPGLREGATTVEPARPRLEKESQRADEFEQNSPPPYPPSYCQSSISSSPKKYALSQRRSNKEGQGDE